MAKRYLITGGAGFIGSAMVRRLVSNPDNQVLNLDKLTYAGNLSSLSSVAKCSNYTFQKKDITDGALIAQTVCAFQPDVIINFAAESHVDRSISGPKAFLDTNIMGTFNLLEACRLYLQKSPQKKEVFRFHHVSTDEVYGSLGATGSFSESTPYDPRSPYSASKASSDHFVRAWYHTYDLPITLSNCSNNYGPFHFPEKLIPLTILCALHDKHIPVYGTGKNIRDWLFVDDHIKGISLILEKGEVGESYNIGGHGEKTNIEVVKQICSILDEKLARKKNDSFSKLIQFVEDRSGHDFRYAINAQKIKNLGWKPETSFDSGLEETIDWYLNNKWWWQPLWTNFKRTHT